MQSLSGELIFLILQFLDEEKYKETVHKLEQESGIYFNMKYFEESILEGKWEEVEKYLSGFTTVEDNRYSMKIFFEIRKQKYLEALDKHDRSEAVNILIKDLKTFSAFNKDLFKEITQLLTLDNFRENEQLSKYGDANSARAIMMSELKKLVQANPKLQNKLQFPTVKGARLRAMINQSLNWQHQLCKNPRQNPEIKTLYHDHMCPQPNAGGRVASPAPPIMNMMPNTGGFAQMAQFMPFQPLAGPVPPSIANWMTNASNAGQISLPGVSGSVSGMPPGLGVVPVTASLLKRPMTSSNGTHVIDLHAADSEHVPKRQRPMGTSNEIGISTGHQPMGYPGRVRYPREELPVKVAVVLNQGSAVTSMDFHPSQPTVLLVGTNVGDITVWEASTRERLAHRKFKVWNIQACSMLFQSSMHKEQAMSVKRIIWNSDGTQFGVAYSRNLVHLYNCNGREDLIQHLEIDAHVGAVNDIAFLFSQLKNKLFVITCGDDKTVKVWDAANGVVNHTFGGNETAVYSICPHKKEDTEFIFSTSVDGKIKAWQYAYGVSRFEYTAPGQSCTTMVYSADLTRLFSCGTSKEGDSYIVEWNEAVGTVKRTYIGLRSKSAEVIQFDTTKNRFLAAGEESLIKFWDMDNINVLAFADAEGGLPASPRLRFNKLGSLLAVSTTDNCIKVLATSDGLNMLRSLESRYNNAPRPGSEAIIKASDISQLGPSSAMAGTSNPVSDQSAPVPPIVGLQNGDSRSLVDMNPRIDESLEEAKMWKLAEINEPSQCCTLKLPDNLVAAQISRLVYTNSGTGILALASNCVHKLWKWQKTEKDTGKATASVPPQLWQPSSGLLMTNEISKYRRSKPEEAVHCFALSKNDSYVMSASGGRISLYNMTTFKTMTTFFPPPPHVTFLAFHPEDNNVIAIGLDDYSVQIYNVRVDSIKCNLFGHQKKITGLAFSNELKVLVSSGADAQLCVWGTDGWKKKASKFLQTPSGQALTSVSDTKVQFHQDQVTFLVVHETQLAIYEAAGLDCSKQWTPKEVSITDATYSCDSQMVYTSFIDGSIGIFTKELQLRCHINPTAYITSQPSSNVYPLVIAAHPTEPTQFAAGLTDGSVHVLEPLDSDKKWGTDPPPENGIPTVPSPDRHQDTLSPTNHKDD